MPAAHSGTRFLVMYGQYAQRRAKFSNADDANEFCLMITGKLETRAALYNKAHWLATYEKGVMTEGAVKP